MINETLINFILICDSIISLHLCIATKGQRSRVSGKLFLSSVVPLVANGGGGGSIGTLKQLLRNVQRDFVQTHARRCGVVSM